MSIDVLLLALTSVIRPTSTAAVIAMLSARHPHRLLAAYVVAGLAFTLAVGMLIVFAARSANQQEAQAAGRPVLDIVLGAAAVGYAAAVGLGWLPRPRDQQRTSRAASDWMRLRLQGLSPPGAAAAGVLTHLPGLVYLAALNAIVVSTTGTVDSLVQVAVYNAIWFSLAIGALVVAVYRPSLAREWLDRLTSWARRRQRVIIVVFLGAVGSYLIISGVLGLGVRLG